MMYQQSVTIDTQCYGWTLANSQPSVGLKVARLNIISVKITIAIYFLKILV